MFTRPPFPRSKVPPVKPQYIVLFKGDDSDFQGNQSVDIVIDTELDTTGMKAHFRFMDFVQDFDSIPDNKTLSIVFPNAKTSEFPLGAADATLRFEDASGKFRTVSNRIHIVVTNSVHEAYDNEDSQSITVTVKGTVKWETIEGKPTFSTVATSGSYNDLLDKPTIPAPVTIDSALSQTSENPVQNKVVAKALYTGFTEWVFVDAPSGLVMVSQPVFDDVDSVYTVVATYNGNVYQGYTGEEAQESTSLVFSFDIFQTGPTKVTATRHLITPTKTSQLTNDSGFLTQHQDISGKLDGVAAYTAWDDSSFQGYWPTGTVVSWKGKLYRTEYGTADPSEPGTSAGAADWAEINIQSILAAKANASDVATELAQKASMTDLPYAMVTPGEWEFSDGGSHTVNGPILNSNDKWIYNLDAMYKSYEFDTEADALSALSLTFLGSSITATRASLPGHLLDRAGNRVVVSGDTTLTLPSAITGHLRDFLVRLEISGSTVPTITFSPDGNESVTYETDGDEFPVPDEAGTWLYSFTESCVAHKFAVSLKKVNEVAAPQAQGGS